MAKMTASRLKASYESIIDGMFFTRNNMKFAGDTMSNYYVPAATVMVETWSNDQPIECYELQRRKPVKHGLSGSSYFNAETFAIVHGKS